MSTFGKPLKLSWKIGRYDLRSAAHRYERGLIDDYQISYLGAGREVLRFGAASRGQPTAAVVAAGPDFDLRRAGKVRM